MVLPVSCSGNHKGFLIKSTNRVKASAETQYSAVQRNAATAANWPFPSEMLPAKRPKGSFSGGQQRDHKLVKEQMQSLQCPGASGGDGTRGLMPACACCTAPQPSDTGSAGFAELSSGPVPAFAGSARARRGAPHRGDRLAPFRAPFLGVTWLL